MIHILLTWLRVLAVLALFGVAGTASAQELPDFDAFRSLANATETDIQEDRLSSEAFERLRASLVEWRKRLLDAQNANAVQIEALTAQLNALGPAPEEGATEPDDIAARREALNKELATAREPRLQAEEAHARANALIGRIDTTLRNRQTDAFFQLRDSPLDPLLWGSAAAWFGTALTDINAELVRNLALKRERGTLWDGLPMVILLLLAAVVLVSRGPGWVEHLIRRIEARAGEQGRVVYSFIVSLGAIAMPVVGISLINAALISTDLLGETGRSVAVGINLLIFAYAAGRWLGRRMFPEGAGPSPLGARGAIAAEGRFLCSLLGVGVGLILIIRSLQSLSNFTVDIASVYSLPAFVLLGFVFFRLGRLLSRTGGDGSAPNFSAAVVRLLGRAVQIIAIVGPLAAMVGYYQMAEALLLPTAVTLWLFGLLGVLHVVIRAIYGLIRGLSKEDAAQALAPVLLSFTLVILSIPVLALIWGARATDLAEVWATFRTGVRLGDATISPGAILTFALVFVLGFLLTRLVQGMLRSSVLPRTRIDKGGQNAIVSGLGYLGIAIAAVVGVTSAGIDLSNLAIIVGALGVGIGFGLQNIVNNFVSGIILLIERPISEGDWVEVNGQMGTVRSISVRSTVIETFDRRDVIVPNGDLISGTVTNWTRGNSLGRVIVPVGVAYGTDTRKVEKILMEIAEAHPIIAVNPRPQVLFMAFGADSLDFEIRAILTDVSFLVSAHSDLNHEIARRFKEEGIEIPFAQRDVWLRNPETIGSIAPAAPRTPTTEASDRSLSEPDGDA